jgi:hypothetical protein
LSTIQTVTETLIRLAKQVIHPDTVLVFPDDLFEVQRTPSVILQGPKLTEDRFRRSQSRLFEKNVAELSFEECRFPRLYHLDFDLVVTVDREAELLGFHESVSRFLQLYPEIAIADQGSLNLTELVPLGGLARVNLSNLRQSSGRIRIESCPVYDGDLTWEAMTIQDTRPIDENWTEYTLVRTFTDNTGNKVRYKAEMTGTPLIYPRIHSLGATLS